MPDRAPLVVIDGLSDPRVGETLKRIREARAQADAAPTTRPTTRESKAAVQGQ
jgi:hypothetical protein